METQASTQPSPNQPKWCPLSSRQRRVAGVLVEKAKTTPDAYPMTLNALTTGCNQKSNRDPLMNLKPEEVETVLDELRSLGVVAEVQSTGRVPKYRHYMYEWLGVDKFEIAVMTELLLRGEQTVGELRGRASRMEPIADLAELRPILQSLIAKGLAISLTPEGRGQVVTHGLYKPRELEERKARIAAQGYASPPGDDSDSSEPRVSPPVSRPVAATMSQDAALEAIAELKAEVAELKERFQQLDDRVRRLEQ